MFAPFVWIFVCFSAGIFAGKYCSIPAWLVAGAMLCAGLSLCSRKFYLALLAHGLFFFLLGQQFCVNQRQEYNNDLRRWVQGNEGETVRIVGQVLSTPEISADYFTLRTRVVSISGSDLSGVVRLTVSGSATQFPMAGDVIETFGRLRLPIGFLAEGTFDYPQYLMKEGIHALGSVKSASLIHIIRRNHSVRFLFSSIRQRMISRIRANFSPSDAAILRALWLDDRSGLSRETEQILIDAGIFHVIAISGFHIGVVVFLSFLLLRKVVHYRIALVVLAIILLLYFLLLEGRSSITRSFLMFLILAFSVWRYETPNWSNVLCLSAMIQLIWNPMELFDPGFHLTYLSTAAILFLAVPVIKKIRLPRKFYQWIFDFLLTTIAIQFVLLPYQAYFFHKIPVISLLANWVAVPVSSILIAIGMIVLPLPFLQAIGEPILHFLLNCFVGSCEFFSVIWKHTIPIPSPILIVLFYLSLLGCLILRGWVIRSISAVVCILTAAVIAFPGDPEPKEYFRIHFIDVGQGDAILLEYPDGSFDLVDGGGSWNRDALDVGESVLVPYLSYCGVRSIHRVFLSHAHADHMNGLLTLLEYLPVQEFYVTRKPVGDPGYQALLRLLPAFPKSLKQGERIDQNGVSIEVLAPSDNRQTLRVANDDSMVLMVEFDGKRIILAGDAEKETESKLLLHNDLMVDFLKVPHHGSLSSSTGSFLDKMKMKAVFISVGRQNWFGHPHPEVLKRYRQRHALIYRTDQLGTIRLTLTGNQSSIDSYIWSH